MAFLGCLFVCQIDESQTQAANGAGSNAPLMYYWASLIRSTFCWGCTLNMLPKNKQRGFTVLELAMAVAVILILVMVAIPQFVEYTKKSEDSAAQADARAFLIAGVAAAQAGEDAGAAKAAPAK